MLRQCLRTDIATHLSPEQLIMNDYWVNLGSFKSVVIDVAVAASLRRPARVVQHMGGCRRQAFLQQLSIPSVEQLLGSATAGGQAVTQTFF